MKLQFLSILQVVLQILPILPFVTTRSLYTNPSDLPTKEYDFIVVGAGTAGSVVAARLSEDSTKRVLVVEAGVDDTGILPIQVPFLASSNQKTIVDWNFTTVPQGGLNNRTLTVPRGFVLGGSSSINLMVWTRGSKDWWDRYVEVTGDKSWSWDALEPYWRKISTLVPPTSNPIAPAPPSYDPTLSNGNIGGQVLVNLPNFPTELDERVFNASMFLHHQGATSRFKYTSDMNTGDSLGFGYPQMTTGHGQRSSSATAYLHPALDSRTNLDVLIHTRVTRLLQQSDSEEGDIGAKSHVHTFNQVELAQSSHGPRFTFHAKHEIILSGGAIGTPHILLLSGIGPKKELEDVGVHVVVDRPAVGKNLHDHPMLVTPYSVNSNLTFDDVLRDPALQQQYLDQWERNKTGLFSITGTNPLGFLRLPEQYLESVKDPTSGPDAPHLEFIFGNVFSTTVDPLPAEGHFITIRTVVLSPKSSGSLTLATIEGGTFNHPLIDYNLLSDPFDVQAMLQAISDTDTFLSTVPWTRDNFIISLVGQNSNRTTEEKIAFMRNNTITVWHPVGTARTGKGEDSVTDPRLRVRGVKGVRVVDASVFPTIPECHPQAVIYTLAERAADIIKEDNRML